MADPIPPVIRRHTCEYHQADRLKAQTSFVRSLAGLHPTEGLGWPALADRAEALWDAAVARGADLTQALTEAEAVIAPVGPVAKQYTIHCVGHAHIDMNWQWPWQETVSTTLDTVRTILRLMDEFPGFCFSQSQASVYEILRRYDPALLAAVKRRIGDGRWEVTASHWVEGDRNMASAESLTRHLLLTRRWMQEHLGLKPEDVAVDWVPDCFGHSARMPAFDSRGAVTYYYLWRSGGTDRPPAFWWKAPDGSKVLVLREISRQGYNAVCSPDQVQSLVEFSQATGLKSWMTSFGVGDHGGGPTRRNIARVLAQDAWPVFPRWRFSTTKAFFRELAGRGDHLPTWERELNSEYSGCLVSQSQIKRANRQGENVLAEAEAAAALARARGYAIPDADLREAWHKVLLTHFHDILPGSGVRATRHYACAGLQDILAVGQTVQSAAYRTLTAAIDTSFVGTPTVPNPCPELEPVNLGAGAGFMAGNNGGGQFVDGFPAAVVVFNPSSWERSSVASLRVWEGNTVWQEKPPERPFVLKDASGQRMRAQRLGTGRYWGHSYVELAVPVTVAAGGWTTFAVEEDGSVDLPKGAVLIREVEGNRNHPPVVPLPAGRLGLENQRFTVLFDRQRGGIASLKDRSSGREFVPAGQILGLPEIAVERPYPMSSWIINDLREATTPTCESLEVVHEGPYLVALTAKFRHGDSAITLTWTLAEGEAHLRLAVSVRWMERGGPDRGTPRLTLRFPLAIADGVAVAEIPGGMLERHEPAGRTMPCLRHVAVRGSQAAAVLANDGVYDYAWDGNALVVHLVRSSYDPDPLPEIGDHAWQFTLSPVVGTLSAVAAYRAGVELNHPLKPAITDGHAGTLPATSAVIAACEPSTVAITQIKPAEDGRGLIVRLADLTGTAATARVRLDPTLYGKAAAAIEVDLLERPLSTNRAVVTAEGFTVPMPAHGMVSVRVG